MRAGHDILDETPNVIVMVVAPAAVAAEVMQRVVDLLERHAGIVTQSDVEALRGEQF